MVITSGNKEPGGFGNRVFSTKQASQTSAFEIKTPEPAYFGNLAEKNGASSAFRGLLFLQQSLLSLCCYLVCLRNYLE
jgi:hypothetical protein